MEKEKNDCKEEERNRKEIGKIRHYKPFKVNDKMVKKIPVNKASLCENCRLLL